MKGNRYIRQTSLKDFGSDGQQKLKNSRVLVVGIGGLGIPVLQYLNAMGVGTLGMVEQDIVDISNIQRQVMYSESDIGKSKLEVAHEKLVVQNSETCFKIYDTFLTRDNALDIIAGYDLVVDASDNFPTRYLINDTCVILNIPFIYGALHGFEGQISVFNFDSGPTYRCLFPKMPSNKEVPNCNDNGVLGVIPGIVGNLQALEAVKVITGIGEVMSGMLLLFNGLNQSYQKIKLKLNPSNLNITQLQESYETPGCSSLAAITVEDLQQLIDTKTSLQIIDVRTLEEFVTSHLPKTKNIPLDELEVRGHEMDFNQPVYFLCQSGARSQIAQEQMQLEFPETEFISILGGINTYMTVCS